MRSLWKAEKNSVEFEVVVVLADEDGEEEESDNGRVSSCSVGDQKGMG